MRRVEGANREWHFSWRRDLFAWEATYLIGFHFRREKQYHRMARGFF
jgi:hypothetical protein